jgi:GTPase SAR1 family protein
VLFPGARFFFLLLSLLTVAAAGQEEFSSLRDTYIKASEGFLLVYSVTSVRTFQHAQKLLTHIQKMKSARVPVVLVGNKADMEDQREVTKDEGSTFASQTYAICFVLLLFLIRFSGISFFETSAKTALNVLDSFHQLVRLVTQARSTATPVTGAREKKGCVLL